jgi:hypothetical protein
MASMDVFNQDAFSLISLSGAIDRMPYTPQFLGELGIFAAEPVNNSTVWVDEREGAISLIQTSPRGSAPKSLARDERKARAFKVPRIAKETTLQAAEIASLRAFGTESEQERVMTEFMRRMDRVRNNVELTHEHMRIGALKGELLDADGSVIYNWFDEFQIAPADDVEFDFTDDTADIAGIARQMARSMARSSKGALGPNATIHALTGDEFYDALINHPQVRQTYLNWAAAADLRNQAAFGAFTYGGVTWHNYRGTDEESTVSVDADEAHVFPIGGNGVFKHIMAPADEFMPYVGAPGQNVYAMTIRDRDRDAFVTGEIYSYPLYMCARPEVLRKAVIQ